MVAWRARLGTLECGDKFLHVHRSHEVFLFETLTEPILGTAKLCLTLLLLLIILLNALRSRTPG